MATATSSIPYLQKTRRRHLDMEYEVEVSHRSAYLENKLSSYGLKVNKIVCIVNRDLTRRRTVEAKIILLFYLFIVDDNELIQWLIWRMVARTGRDLVATCFVSSRDSYTVTSHESRPVRFIMWSQFPHSLNSLPQAEISSAPNP